MQYDGVRGGAAPKRRLGQSLYCQDGPATSAGLRISS